MRKIKLDCGCKEFSHYFAYHCPPQKDFGIADNYDLRQVKDVVGNGGRTICVRCYYLKFPEKEIVTHVW